MKKNQKNLMMGGLALGGVYLLTKSNSSSLLPRSRSVRASSANETGGNSRSSLFYQRIDRVERPPNSATRVLTNQT